MPCHAVISGRLWHGISGQFDRVATTNLTEEQNRRFMPRFLDIDSLVRQLILRAKVDFDQTAEVIVRLEATGTNAFGREFGTYSSKYPDTLPLPIIERADSPAVKARRRKRKTLRGRAVRRVKMAGLRLEFKRRRGGSASA